MLGLWRLWRLWEAELPCLCVEKTAVCELRSIASFGGGPARSFFGECKWDPKYASLKGYSS